MDLKTQAKFYYKRKEIQKAIADHAKNREVIPRYGEGFGKRPDIIEYPGDIGALAEKGATSFHFSEELWHNPLDLSTGLTPEKLNDLRKGWDLIMDIDSKFLGFSKISAELIIGALKFHNINNIGLKFSGRAGWHIMVPFDAFPKEVHGVEIKTLFPSGPRMVAGYLSELIENALRDRILETTTPKELAERTGKAVTDFYVKDKFNPFSVVDIDTIAISPRHLIRSPYSLNEKSGFASIVIEPKQIKNFHISWAQPSRVIPKPFFPTPEKDEAKELIIQSFDWQKIQESKKKVQELTSGIQRKNQNKNHIIIKNTSTDMWPPCIQNALKGIKDDGRKRCLFVLLNFFKSINLSPEDIKEKIHEWNKKNAQPLKQGYVVGQLTWHLRNKVVLPPNCEKIQTMYKDLLICTPEPLCRKIKNPINYTAIKYRIKSGEGTKSKYKRKSSRRKEEGETRVFRGRI